jgi:UDP-N-acetylmuramoyl-L-alanyl-D-glutamate--2,6-diaminopimelate ligase
MTLGALRRRLEAVLPTRLEPPDRGTDVDGLVVTAVDYDSRQVSRGHLFVAIRGQREDGAAFAPQAIARGAVAVIAESRAPAGVTIPWFVVDDTRLALATLAAAFHGDPSHHMQVVGITGTNGKTTVSYLVRQIYEQAGVPCGRIGTVGYLLGGNERPAPRTTPEAPDVQALLREMVDAGCGACAMEVSSHALSLKRVDGMRFAAGVFTNLTRDHLDFHGDMESYFQAKRRLFEMLPPGAPAVINLDDPRGAALAQDCRRPVTFAVARPADVTPGPVSLSLDGIAFDAGTPRGSVRVRSRLRGRFNVANVLAAVAVAVALDLPLPAIEGGVALLEHVPGRFQVISGPEDDVAVVVDYAHTDDALKNLLETARPLARGRLVTVFGCGGDRDRTKRPLMGAVAARLSDVVIVTSDNPRSEEPTAIIEEIRRGIDAPPDRAAGRPGPPRAGRQEPVCLSIVDRRTAIERAVSDALAGDLIVIAGKGHEKYQEIAGRTLPFDDVQIGREALERRRTGSAA